jgi:hypothetical protein
MSSDQAGDSGFFESKLFSMRQDATAEIWDNERMAVIKLTRPAEQRKIERLLIKLAKTKPIAARPAPIASGERVLKSA